MFTLDTQAFFTPKFTKHYYTFACTGLDIGDREFSSRHLAEEYMRKQCKRVGLSIKEIWKDNHDVTFICSNNVKFYIQRV